MHDFENFNIYSKIYKHYKMLKTVSFYVKN